jgi:hypothetical protein
MYGSAMLVVAGFEQKDVSLFKGHGIFHKIIASPRARLGVGT